MQSGRTEGQEKKKAGSIHHCEEQKHHLCHLKRLGMAYFLLVLSRYNSVSLFHSLLEQP